MMLKVADGAGAWHLFDKVDHVHFVTAVETVTRREDLKRYESDSIVNLISRDCFRNGVSLNVGIISFYRGDDLKKILFTTTAYILDDKGDTLEKIQADGQRKRGI